MPCKILLVENDAETRDILTRLLQKKSYDVVGADDGYRAVLMLPDERPDLIVSDLRMPYISGLQLINIIRADCEYDRTPILAITAYGAQAAEQAISAGADRAIAKPVDPDVLFDAISELLASGNVSQSQATSH